MVSPHCEPLGMPLNAEVSGMIGLSSESNLRVEQKISGREAAHGPLFSRVA